MTSVEIGLTEFVSILTLGKLNVVVNVGRNVVGQVVTPTVMVVKMSSVKLA